ncbi:hypothetical protein [Actinoplanes derwentensis]|uniref:hypothetical protein n=1 Tax=Actinoplanes derwentensis TaxID=113562 RepID=UPI0012FDF9BE|nr:hypothetical protein [Actinoplanes derwentensis]GID84577.1 hypothetical protein Ade03nite_35010 [Actinoplanes derwentensis]
MVEPEGPAGIVCPPQQRRVASVLVGAHDGRVGLRTPVNIVGLTESSSGGPQPTGESAAVDWWMADQAAERMREALAFAS